MNSLNIVLETLKKEDRNQFETSDARDSADMEGMFKFVKVMNRGEEM